MVHMVIKLERQLKRKDNSKPSQNSGSFLSWRPNYKKGWHITPKGKPNYLRVRKMSPLILEVTLTTNHTIIMI